jgi:multiple sugar transport system permease protein
MLMLSSSIASSFDFDDLRIIPKYMTDDDALFKKQLFAKYGQTNFRDFCIIYKRDGDWATWSSVRAEKDFRNRNVPDIQKYYHKYPKQSKQRIADWQAFKQTLNPGSITYFYPDNYDAYRDFLKHKYSTLADKQNGGANDNKDAIKLLNKNWQRAFNSFAEILPLKSFLKQQKWFPPKRADFDDLIAYNSQLKSSSIKVVPTEMLWALYLEKRFVNVVNFVKRTGIQAKKLTDIKIPTVADKKLYPIWLEFLKSKYPMRLIAVNGNYTKQWQQFLKEKFHSVAAFNTQTNQHITSFSDITFSPRPPTSSILRSFWLDFVLKKIPPETWSLNRPVTRYQQFLAATYKTIDNLNSAYATDFKQFSNINMPLKLADFVNFTSQKNALRWSFFTLNYKKVLTFLSTKGRAVWVTIVLISLTILGALTVNPLAAYALSRGKQSVSSKILIFFLATMAFPAEVAMIPGFLLLRDLNLLNTFAALVLPGLANGYSIFLLKGFFDSVPRELYEAADIDGADELTKFWKITFPMSKPILAVISLNAFTMAYGGFMWAFLTCQNPRMWTIMVWLYDFQGRYGHEPGMCMAAFALASIPTLLVFLFCQKIIMRGIVIPTMK